MGDSSILCSETWAGETLAETCGVVHLNEYGALHNPFPYALP